MMTVPRGTRKRGPRYEAHRTPRWALWCGWCERDHQYNAKKYGRDAAAAAHEDHTMNICRERFLEEKP